MNGPTDHRGLRVNERGLTLMEVMMALAISVIVVGGAYQVLYNSQQIQTVNEQAVQTQQNSRLAMELIALDLKDAGFNAQSLAAGIGNCGVNAILPADNNPAGNDTGPDSISMIVPVELSTLKTQITGAAPTANVVLQTGAVATAAIDGFGVAGTPYAMPAPGAVISLAGLQIGTVTAAPSDTVTLSAAVTLPATAVLPVGTQIYWLKCVMYKIVHPSSNVATEQPLCGGTLPCLVRGTPPCLTTQPGPACVAVADGIEDLQVSYACDGCVGLADGVIDDQAGGIANQFDAADFVSNSAWNAGVFTPLTIRLAQVSVVARQVGTSIGSESASQGAKANFTLSPLVVSDHNHANGVFAAGDLGTATALTTYQKQQRRVLTRIVQLRNLGLF